MDIDVKAQRLAPLALELLNGLDKDKKTFPRAHLDEIVSKIRKLKRDQMKVIIEDCLRIAYVLYHQDKAYEAACEIEKMCDRALHTGNEHHGRLAPQTESQARVGYEHRSFEGTERAFAPAPNQPKPTLNAQALRPDLFPKRA